MHNFDVHVSTIVFIRRKLLPIVYCSHRTCLQHTFFVFTRDLCITITGGKGVEGGEGGDVANDPDSGNFQDETDFPSPPVSTNVFVSVVVSLHHCVTYYQSSKLVLDAGLVRDVENTGLCHDYLQDFFVVLALCNTVVLSRKTQDTQDGLLSFFSFQHVCAQKK